MNLHRNRHSRLAAAFALAALAVPALAGAQAPVVRFHPREPVRVRAPVKTRVVVHAVSGGYLGVQLVDITRELRKFYGAPEDAGVLVSRVVEDSPAAAAGFEVGDVITAVARHPMERSREVMSAMRRFEPEETVPIEIVRAGAPLTLSATLGEREGGHPFEWAESFSVDLHPEDMDRFRILGEEMPRVWVPGGEAREAVRRALEEARERVGEVDFTALAERLAEAEERLRELEKKLEERER